MVSMDGSRTHTEVSEVRAHAQVLSEEVRTYLLHHGGALDAHDEAALDTFAERFLLPTLGAAWAHGHRTTDTTQPSGPSETNGTYEAPETSMSPPPTCPVNPYLPLGRDVSARPLWWHRLRRHSPGEASRSRVARAVLRMPWLH